MNRSLGILSACLSVFFMMASPASAQTIDTMPAWNGSQFISSFGVPNTATYGQMVTVTPIMGPLQQIQFQIGNCNPNQVDFRFHVYAWDTGTNRATGASLFDGPVQSVATGAAFTLVSVNTGNLTLSPGTYVLFTSTSQDQSVPVACRFGAVADTAYAGGNFKFINNGTNTGQWTGSGWSQINLDLAFRAVFAPAVPTMPVSMLIVLAGLLAVASLARLRSRHRTA